MLDNVNRRIGGKAETMEDQSRRIDRGAQDLRVQRTYRKLRDAFETLLCQKSFDQISVLQICQTAGIRRTTFYQHFQDKQDFLNWYIRDKQQEFRAIEAGRITVNQLSDVFEQMAREILHYFHQNEKLVRNMMDMENSGERVFQLYTKTCVDSVVQRLENVPELERLAQNTPTSFLAEFYVGGMISAFRWWISQDEPCSEEEFLRYLRLRVRKSNDT